MHERKRAFGIFGGNEGPILRSCFNIERCKRFKTGRNNLRVMFGIMQKKRAQGRPHEHDLRPRFIVKFIHHASWLHQTQHTLTVPIVHDTKKGLNRMRPSPFPLGEVPYNPTPICKA